MCGLQCGTCSLLTRRWHWPSDLCLVSMGSPQIGDVCLALLRGCEDTKRASGSIQWKLNLQFGTVLVLPEGFPTERVPILRGRPSGQLGLTSWALKPRGGSTF